MSPHAEHIASMLARYVRGELSIEETAELREWMNQGEKQKGLVLDLANENEVIGMLKEYCAYDTGRMANSLQHEFPGVAYHGDQDLIQKNNPRTAHRVHFLRRGFLKYAAAILIIISAAGGYYIFHTSQTGAGVAHTTPSFVPADIKPGSDKAILTLGSGETIQLDSTANARLNAQGITNNNALIIYSGKGEINTINTLITPKGGQYRIRLSDGTMVWLNAASSITYPAVFTGNARNVSITGEAYFEVVKNRENPFIVRSGKEFITVLGTSFNINNYDDEPFMKTSLLEGAVKINNATLRPGEAYSNGKIIKTDVTQDIAWKNGAFSFKNIDFAKAMRQLARWYDVKIVYDNDLIPKSKLNGEMDRNLTLNDALVGLDGLGARFKLEGKTVHVIAFDK